jgi:DNA adenine methylase
MSQTIKPAFPYIGGKRRVASEIWSRFGKVGQYIEPFFGAGAVLLGRPDYDISMHETVNDLDDYICNFFRAVKAAPLEVAEWCDYPVIESDLTARHNWLITEGRKRLASIKTDPEFFDARVAGWWVWGISQWIGCGWCSKKDGILDTSRILYSQERGKIPNTTPRGTNALPTSSLYSYMEQLSHRLRHVRVCCGDWSRVVTEANLCGYAPCAIFLDPPYSTEIRSRGCYTHDREGVAKEVAKWAIDHGEDKRLRICLAGYIGEHDMPATWSTYRWSGGRCFGGSNLRTKNAVNRHKECLWFSPHCLKKAEQGGAQLF